MKTLTVNPLDVSLAEIKQLKTAVPLSSEANHDHQAFVLDVGRTCWDNKQLKKYHGIE